MNDGINRLTELHDELFKNGEDLDIAGHDAYCASVKQIEDNLVNEFKTVIKNLPLCIHEISTNGLISKINPAGLKMLSADAEYDIIGNEYMTYVHNEDQVRISALLKNALKGKSSKFKFKSPNNKYFSSCFIPVMSGDAVEKIIGYTHDITEYYESR
jgi:transcriptional regulator with PAS, ATPase and Fis domain